MSKKYDEGMDKSVVREISKFGFGGDISDSIDARTDINNSEITKSIIYYRILEGCFACKEAGIIANITEKLLVSKDRMGRTEAVQALMQKFPKSEKMYQEVEKIVVEETQPE